jgi:hypothetical protein
MAFISCPFIVTTKPMTSESDIKLFMAHVNCTCYQSICMTNILTTLTLTITLLLLLVLGSFPLFMHGQQTNRTQFVRPYVPVDIIWRFTFKWYFNLPSQQCSVKYFRCTGYIILRYLTFSALIQALNFKDVSFNYVIIYHTVLRGPELARKKWTKLITILHFCESPYRTLESHESIDNLLTSWVTINCTRNNNNNTFINLLIYAYFC